VARGAGLAARAREEKETLDVTTTDDFVRRATLVRVVDGDTFEMMIDYGYREYGRKMIRVRGYDAPELSTPEGARMKAQAEQVFAGASTIVVRSYKDHMSFARWIADVYVDDISIVTLLASTPSSVVPL
jgi:endonuclease YncB( thermonuclease family)